MTLWQHIVLWWTPHEGLMDMAYGMSWCEVNGCRPEYCPRYHKWLHYQMPVAKVVRREPRRTQNRYRAR